MKNLHVCHDLRLAASNYDSTDTSLGLRHSLAVVVGFFIFSCILITQVIHASEERIKVHCYITTAKGQKSNLHFSSEKNEDAINSFQEQPIRRYEKYDIYLFYDHNTKKIIDNCGCLAEDRIIKNIKKKVCGWMDSRLKNEEPLYDFCNDVYGDNL